CIERNFGHPREVLRTEAVRGLAGLAELLQEFAVARELQYMRVGIAVSADPDVVHVIDGDAVVRRWPGIAFPGPAPVIHEVALGIELEDVRRRYAALARLRIGRRAYLSAFIECIAAMHDEDMVARVDGEADGGTQHPVVRQGLRPERIHLEHRRFFRLRMRRVVECLIAARGNAGYCESRDQCGRQCRISFGHWAPPRCGREWFYSSDMMSRKYTFGTAWLRALNRPL